MDALKLDHFLFVPDATGAEQGILYELTPSSEFNTSSVLVVPYQNPQVAPLQPTFYNIQQARPYRPRPTPVQNVEIQLRARTSKQDYLKTVKALKQEIQLGNIYEINYCMEFFAEQVHIDPFAVFLKLQNLSRAPYAAILKTGNDLILCASPELFLKKEGNRLSSKPIKGTAKRGATVEEDQQLKEQLHQSLKERTENVMAVDVARNDLSMLAARGTVTVNKLYNIETFETVHQMVSTVSCELKQDLNFSGILEATFPMASMTGAPKLRAMSLSDTYENFKRSYYSGCMGMVDERGDFELWVVIRSIFYNLQSKRLSMAVGGAITYLSEPEKEYDECLLKARSMLKALNARLV